MAATDLSDASLAAIRYAAELTKPFRAELVLCHAVEPLVMAGDPFPVPAAVSLLEQVEESSRKRVEALALQLRKRRIRCRSAIVNGSASAAIVRAATRLKADLIVIGTHGRTGLSHLLMGSVAEKVVRMATCPVLTVRSDGSGGRSTRRRRPRRARRA